jgi:ribonuclease HII
MRECIRQVLMKTDPSGKDTMLVIDGNDFLPYTVFDEDSETLREVPHITIEKGDNTYSFIAAASILAKNAHDEYILQLCEEYPELKTRYNLHENVGYGTAKHLAGIREHGITQWHRKTFGSCKNAVYSPL